METLILAFISKTGRSVEYFHLDFSTRERIYLGILYAELQIPYFKCTRDITKQRGFFTFFVDFSSAQPAQHISCRVILIKF